MRVLVFINADAIPKNTRIECSTESVAHIMAWYGSHHCGDQYTVALDGRDVPMNPWGEPIIFLKHPETPQGQPGGEG